MTFCGGLWLTIRTSLCAHIAHATERVGQKIDLQSLLTDFFQTRRRRLFLGAGCEDA